MNLAELERKLIAAARRQPPGDQVPYTFSARIMARISSRPVPDEAALWARALGRAAAACFAVMILFGAFSLLNPAGAPVTAERDLTQDFESTMLAGVEQDSELPQ